VSASYAAVLFDLFDTLVLFERERLPEVQVNGRTIRSTAGRLHAAFAPFAPDLPLEAFVEALFWSWQEAERIRSGTHREVGAPERFALMFARLGLDAARLASEALPTLLDTHMRELSRAVVVPDHHLGLLRSLHPRHRLAVVSNFDYTPTALRVLEREGLAPLFDAVVVSADLGWRKPKAVVFEAALRQLGVASSQALFVGDRLDIDVAGAQAVGMRTVWVNREGAARPAGGPAPEHEIRDLGELGPIIGA
jgi:FMN phosphatase YigB (HAD superfamily)